MAGGTALALQIGHRISVDFDLFSAAPIKRTLLTNIEQTFPRKVEEVMVSNRNELTVMISGVKFTFLHYPFPVLRSFEESGPIPLLSAKEILASKAYTIGRRGEFKDYIDVYSGLRGGHVTIEEILALASKKYGEAFNDRLFLEQLVYLDDVEETEITMSSDKAPTKAELFHYFSELIQHEPVL